MIPLTLTLASFRSFSTAQTLTFPRRPGLYPVGGENLFQPELASNGAGKSTLFEALAWVLTGETTGGLRSAADLANRHHPGQARVALEFELNGKTHKLIRTAAPNTLTLDGEAIQQDALEQLTGFNKWTFGATVLSGQFETAFLDQSAADKLRSFTAALDLDAWTDRAKTASELEKQAEENVRRAELAIETSKAAYHAVKSQIATAEANRQPLKSRLITLQTALDHASTEQSRLINAINAAKTRHENAQHDLTNAQQIQRTAQHEYHEAKRRHESNQQFTCPTCGQPIKQIHNPHQTRRALQRSQHALEQSNQKFKRDDQTERSQYDQLQSAKRDEVETRRTRNQQQEERDRIKYELDQHERNGRESVETARKAWDQYQASAAPLLKSKEEYARLTRAFRDLRLHLCNNALLRLSIESTACAESLGLPNWNISFALERTNASQRITRGFTILITPPKARQPIRLESYSGGESQRLKIAVSCALNALIREERIIRMPLEVWDEPTKHLSDEGVTDLLEFLSDRATKLNRVIFLIDHRTHAAGRIAGSILVRRQRSGESVIVQQHLRSKDNGSRHTTLWRKRLAESAFEPKP